jgi:hypothetical protein
MTLFGFQSFQRKGQKKLGPLKNFATHDQKQLWEKTRSTKKTNGRKKSGQKTTHKKKPIGRKEPHIKK